MRVTKRGYMGRKSTNPFRFYFGKKFYKQAYGYWVHRTKDICKLAHRWVWENHNGDIPSDMDIHHIDGNKDNNEIENLKMLSRSDHRKEHWVDSNLRYICEAQLNSVRPIDWLKSDEGKKAVSEKGKEVWKNRKTHLIKCEHCGCEKEYRRWARFCSKKCYMAWRWINALKPTCPN
jgi:hypothetical protein